MDLAGKILVIGGVANLLVGAISGIPMGLLRQRGAAVPRYLTLVHMGGLMQGPILLTCPVVLAMSKLSPSLNMVCAALLVACSLMLLLKDALNWRQEVQDEFAEKSAGLRIGQLVGPLYLVGFGLLAAAAVSGF
jgi:hypothetical protein